MSAPVVQWQFVSSRPDEVAAFYAKAFGWTVTASNAIGYRQVKAGDGIEGGIWPAPPGTQSFVQLFVGVVDVQQSVDRAVTLGAEIVVPVTALPDGDTMAILRDPTGVTFGVMRQR
jgi:predicted enzyme related to lactoylglutathione lyase